MRPDPPVLVVGGINLDTLARIDGPTVPATSNPGHTSRTPGGVGRNVAENLVRLGTPVALAGAVGDDHAGRELVSALAELGVVTSAIRRVPGPTGSYTAVLDERGELHIGVSDMSATDALGPDQLPDPTGHAFVVLDGNLRADTLARALSDADRARVPVALDPVGVAKSARLAGLGHLRVHTFTPNRDELAGFTGSDDLDRAVAEAHRRGVQWLWLREGPAGSTLFGADGTRVRVPPVPGEVVNVTGAGDAMLAGYLHALLGGDDPVEAVRYGAAAAALTVASPSTVRPDLDDELVRRTLTAWSC